MAQCLSGLKITLYFSIENFLIFFYVCGLPPDRLTRLKSKTILGCYCWTPPIWHCRSDYRFSVLFEVHHVIRFDRNGWRWTIRLLTIPSLKQLIWKLICIFLVSFSYLLIFLEIKFWANILTMPSFNNYTKQWSYPKK